MTSNLNTYFLYADSEREKDDWIGHIGKAIVRCSGTYQQKKEKKSSKKEKNTAAVTRGNNKDKTGNNQYGSDDDSSSSSSLDSDNPYKY